MKDLKRLLPYIKKYRSRIIGGFFLVTISNICATMVPRIIGQTIDMIGDISYSKADILDNIFLIIALTAGSGIFMYFTRKTIIVASRLIEYDLRKDFLVVVSNRPMSFFHENSPGTLMAYATNDISAAREFLGPAIMYTANSVTTFIFALFFMLNIDPFLTILALSPLPIITLMVYRLGKEIHKSFKAVQEQFAELSSRSQEAFSGIRVVKSYVRESFENTIFNNMSKDYYRKNLRLARVQSAIMPALMVLVGIAQMIVLGFGGWQVMNGTSSLGDLTQFFIYINLLIWPVAAIGWITNIIQRASASIARLWKLLDLLETDSDINTNDNEPEKKQKRNSELFNKKNEFTDVFDRNAIKGDLLFDNISLKYSVDSPYVLKNINLKIPSATSLGITGTVGSGKSTLANLVPSLFEPSEGRILIDDVDIKGIPIKILRKFIAFVPQEQFLFSTSIKENIAFGKPDASDKEIEFASKIACFDEEVKMFPDGYNTILGERGITLSGGQKQRLALARAIVKDPAILILDDALSAVDAQTEEKILQSLPQIMNGRTSIIISHRISTIMNCDNIVVLHNGEIEESGTHSELIERKGKYYQIYSRQKLEEEINML